MPRLRVFKPERMVAPGFSDLPLSAIAAYTILETVADDKGRLVYDTRQIRKQGFPDRPDIDVDAIIDLLSSVGRFSLLERADGSFVLNFSGWSEQGPFFQRIDKVMALSLIDVKDAKEVRQPSERGRRDLAIGLGYKVGMTGDVECDRCGIKGTIHWHLGTPYFSGLVPFQINGAPKLLCLQCAGSRDQLSIVATAATEQRDFDDESTSAIRRVYDTYATVSDNTDTDTDTADKTSVVDESTTGIRQLDDGSTSRIRLSKNKNKKREEEDCTKSIGTNSVTKDNSSSSLSSSARMDQRFTSDKSVGPSIDDPIRWTSDMVKDLWSKIRVDGDKRLWRPAPEELSNGLVQKTEYALNQVGINVSEGHWANILRSIAIAGDCRLSYELIPTIVEKVSSRDSDLNGYQIKAVLRYLTANRYKSGSVLTKWLAESGQKPRDNGNGIDHSLGLIREYFESCTKEKPPNQSYITDPSLKKAIFRAGGFGGIFNAWWEGGIDKAIVFSRRQMEA